MTPPVVVAVPLVGPNQGGSVVEAEFFHRFTVLVSALAVGVVGDVVVGDVVVE